MQDFVEHKDKGNAKMSSKNFKGAIQEYTFVINGLSPENDEQAVLKGVCILNRSLCKIFLKDFEGATADTEECLNFYKSLRPDEQAATATPDSIGQDPLTQILCLIYCRKGQIHHVQEHFLDALQNYSIATMLIPDCDAQNHMKELLTQLGLPQDFNEGDKDLQMFSPIVFHFLNEANLHIALLNLLLYLRQSNDITPDLIAKWDAANVVGVVTPAIALYEDHEIIVVTALGVLRELAFKGINVWHAYPVYFSLFDNWKNHAIVTGELLKLILLAPEETTEAFIRQGFLQAVADAIKLDITDEEVECALTILFKLVQNPNLAIEVTSYDLLDVILDRKTPSSLLLLSKIIILHDVAVRALSEHAVDWILPALSGNHADMEPLAHRRPEKSDPTNESSQNSEQNNDSSQNSETSQNSEQNDSSKNAENAEAEVLPPRKMFAEDIRNDAQLIIAAEFVIADMLKEGEDETLLKECAEKSFKAVFDTVNTNKKDEVIVSNGLAVLALGTPYMIPAVLELKAIQFSSVLLSLHMGDEYIVANTLMLLKNAAANGLVHNVKDCHAVLPAARKALKTHPQVQDVVENAVILAVLCETADKDELLKAAITLFPDSKVLKPYGVALLQSVQEPKK